METIAPSVRSQSVFVVEDQPLVWEFLRIVIETLDGLHWRGACANLSQSQASVFSSDPPDIVLVDIVLKDGFGWQILPKLPKHIGRPKFVFISGSCDERSLAYCCRADVWGFIDKTACTLTDWRHALLDLAAGRRYFSTAAQQGIDRIRSDSSHWTKCLTDRECEMLPLFGQGWDNIEIGENLRISPGTVHSHRRNILRKLDLHSSAQLMNWVSRKGLLN